MGKDHHRHRFLSESSNSNSGSRSRSKSRSRSGRRSRSPKRHKDSSKHHRHNKHSRSRSPRHRPKRSRSGSNRRNRRRSRDRHSRRNRNEEEDDRDARGYGRDGQPQNGNNPADTVEPEEAKIEVEKPCFIPSGILAKFSNTVNGVTLKFTEPLDAAVPVDKWRIFPFKGDEALPALFLHRQSCYLIGKDPNVCDIVVENPTCSSQHAVIQFREVKKMYGETREIITLVKPYIMDLESKNGTFLNQKKLEPARYYELLHEDVIKLASSSRDYVMMKDEE